MHTTCHCRSDTPPVDPSAFWEHWAAVLCAHPDQPRRVKVCDTDDLAKSTARDIRRDDGKGLVAFRGGGFKAKSSGRTVWAVYGDWPDPDLTDSTGQEN